MTEKSNGMKKKDGYDFNEYLSIYKKNETEDELVQALMELPADQRNIFILYLEEGSILRLAKRLHVSVQLIRKELNEIKEQIRDRYELLKSENKNRTVIAMYFDVLAEPCIPANLLYITDCTRYNGCMGG